MRNFSKKLAFVLAAAMVFTAFAPAAKADAADKEMTMNRASQTLYVNEDGVNQKGAETLPEGLYGNVQTYDFYVKNKPANYAKELNFVWKSSDPKVAEVNEKNGDTKAVAVGTATITCTITDKATGDPVTEVSAKVTVKANAASVVITNAEDYDGTTLGEDRVVDLNRAMYDEAGNKTSKRGTFVTDYTRWIALDPEGEKVTDKTIVDIDQATGKFTFGEAAPTGDYTLYCETYQSDKYNQTTAESDPVVVTVVDAKNTFEAEQKSLDTFVLTFDKAVESLTKKDLSIKKVRVNAATGKQYTTVVTVKDVALDANDKTKATVTIFGSFADAINYDIAITGFEDTFTLTASAGLPVGVEVTATIDGVNVGDVLVKGKDGLLVAKFYDANGIDVTKAGYKPNYSLAEYSKTGAYTLITTNEGTKLSFKKTDEFAAVNVKYQKRDGNKLLVDINETFYFGAEEPTPIFVTGLADFSLNDFNTQWNKQSLQLKEKNCYLKVKVSTDDPAEKNPTLIDLTVGQNKIAKADGTPVFSFTAVNPEICNITSTGLLVPYKADTAAFYVNMSVKGANGQYGEAEPIDVIYIDVLENSKFVDFTLDKYDVTVGNVPGYDKAEIKATLVDQYGQKKSENALTIKGVSENAKLAESKIAPLTAGDVQTITIYGSDLEAAVAGSEQYKIAPGSAATFEFKATFGNVEKFFTVTVMTKGDDNANYVAVENNGTTSALRVDDADDSNDNAEKVKYLTFSVFKMNNGVKVAPQTFTLCPTKPEEIEKVKAGSYFYKVTKNGKDITAGYVDDTAGDSVTIKLSGEDGVASGSAIGTGKVVNYKETGAGEYTFELFYSWYDGQITSMETNTVVVNGGDAGAYSIASQEKNNVKLTSSYTMKDGEVSSITVDKNEILKCFKFNGRDGKEVDLTKETVDVKYDATEGTGSVYVESITVYKKVVDDYVAYNIPVNVVLTRDK